MGGRTGSRPFPRCPPFHLSSSLGKPVFQLSLGQQQWEKVTSWKVTYLRHDHTLPVPQPLWEIHSWLGLEEAAFLGMRPGLIHTLVSLHAELPQRLVSLFLHSRMQELGWNLGLSDHSPWSI